jgi:hypothetical protein
MKNNDGRCRVDASISEQIVHLDPFPKNCGAPTFDAVESNYFLDWLVAVNNLVVSKFQRLIYKASDG